MLCVLTSYLVENKYRVDLRIIRGTGWEAIAMLPRPCVADLQLAVLVGERCAGCARQTSYRPKGLQSPLLLHRLEHIETTLGNDASSARQRGTRRKANAAKPRR